VCDRITGSSGSPLPPRPRPFDRAQRYLSVRRPPQTHVYGFILPRAFRLLQSSSDLRPALRTPKNLAAFRKPESASLGVHVPHRDVSKRRPLGARGSQASSYGPSSTFRTSSTVYSATCLAGLFHPAAASRVCPSGVCSSPRSRAGFPRPIHALLPLREGACGVTRASDFALGFRALLPAASAVPTKPVKAPFGPRPSWASPPPGLPSLHRGNAFAPPPPATFTATSPSQLVLGVSPVQGSVCLGPGYRPARGFRPEPPSSFRETGSRPRALTQVS